MLLSCERKMQFLLARGTATEFIPLSEDYLKNSLQNWLSICCCWNLCNSQKLKMKVESFWLHHQIVPLNFFTSLVTLFQLGKFQRHWLLTIQLTAFNPKPQSVCAITLSCPCDMIMCNCWHPGFRKIRIEACRVWEGHIHWLQLVFLIYERKCNSKCLEL